MQLQAECGCLWDKLSEATDTSSQLHLPSRGLDEGNDRTQAPPHLWVLPCPQSRTASRSAGGGGQDDPRVAGILQVNSIGPLLGHPPAASSYALSAILPARPGGTLSCLGQAGDAGDRILERLQREGPGSYRGTASASGAKAWTELEGTRAGTRAGAEVQLPRRTLEEVRTQDWEEGKTVTPLLALELGMLFRMPSTRAKQPGICLLALTGHRWPQDRVQSLKQRSTSKGDSQRVAAPPTRQAQAAQCHSHCPPPLVLSGPVCLAWKQPFLDSGELTRWW